MHVRGSHRSTAAPLGDSRLDELYGWDPTYQLALK